MSEPMDYQKHCEKIMGMTEKELDAELEKLVGIPEKMRIYKAIVNEGRALVTQEGAFIPSSEWLKEPSFIEEWKGDE